MEVSVCYGRVMKSCMDPISEIIVAECSKYLQRLVRVELHRHVLCYRGKNACLANQAKNFGRKAKAYLVKVF